MRWWGWGEDGHGGELPQAATALLGAELGGDGSQTATVAPRGRATARAGAARRDA